MTKYAEWRTLQCGNCEWLYDVGTIADKRMDPSCDMHREFRCMSCGVMTDASTPWHGKLGDGFHVPEGSA